jgi:hypothetical protein
MLLLAAVIAVSLAFAGSGEGDARTGTAPASPVDPTSTLPPAGDAPTPTPRPVPTPGLDDVLYDARRALDLGALRDALAQYRARFGVYPSTANVVTTLCADPGDAGCALRGIDPALAFGDGEYPYWYKSDGITYYRLISRAQTTTDTGQCGELPSDLADVPVLCLYFGG